MGRAPCCDKVGIKKGPWSPEEDQILFNFIALNGHENWRALPKKAGLMRCGKSCRLRWINYLRPDLKRGNFTREEEDTIINLHQMLGNRWSAIAAQLPGRTDNEIKNVWHTHLKKRLINNRQQTMITKQSSSSVSQQHLAEDKPQLVMMTTSATNSRVGSTSTCNHVAPSPQPCSSSTEDISSSNKSNVNIVASNTFSSNNEFLDLDESFWSEVLSEGNTSTTANTTTDLPFSPISGYGMGKSHDLLHGGDGSNEMEFWYEVFNRSEDAFVPKLL